MNGHAWCILADVTVCVLFDQKLNVCYDMYSGIVSSPVLSPWITNRVFKYMTKELLQRFSLVIWQRFCYQYPMYNVVVFLAGTVQFAGPISDDATLVALAGRVAA